jgi:hypothetical protein
MSYESAFGTKSMTSYNETANRPRRRSLMRRALVATAGLALASPGRPPLGTTMSSNQAQSGKPLRTFVLAGVALLLGWLVVTHSLALYLAGVSPKAALWLSPGEPQALVDLADRSLNSTTPFPSGNAALGPQADNAGGSAGATAPPGSGSGSPAPGAPDSNSSSSAAGASNDSVDSESVDQAFDVIGRNKAVDLATIRTEAETALASDPLNPGALRILGQAAAAARNQPEALKFMQAAAQTSLHESTAVYWLMLKSAEAGKPQTAIAYGDALLRSNLALSPYVTPLLGHYADTAPTNAMVKSLVLSDPPWRREFFASLPRSVSDLRTPLDILLALKGSATPATAEEVGFYLNYLIDHKRYDLAYYAWLQLLPADELAHLGLLHNGSFAEPPSGSPFDWTITQGSGVAIDIVPNPDSAKDHALSVDFLYGRVDYHSVNQLVVLAPGTYQFAGQYKGELIGPRGLKWRIACANNPSAPIAESPMIGGVAATWKDVKFNFTVPDAGCPAQYVRLDLDARMASEQIVNGSMLFADLDISRLPDAADADDSDADAPATQKSDQ